MVELIGDGIGPDSQDNVLSAAQRNADALTEICSTQLAQSSDAHRSTVVIEADISMFSDGTPGVIEGVGIISDQQVHRLLRAAAIELKIMENGKTIGTGRKTRLFPPIVIRGLKRRDRGCRFPGCERRRWLQAHHIAEWFADCGESNEHNGLMLCSHHHQFVHEFGWTIEGDPYGALTFINPEGRRYRGMPPPLRPDVKAKTPLRDLG